MKKSIYESKCKINKIGVTNMNLAIVSFALLESYLDGKSLIIKML